MMVVIFLQGVFSEPFFERAFRVNEPMATTTLTGATGTPAPHRAARFVPGVYGNRWGGLRRICAIVLGTWRAARQIRILEKSMGGIAEAQTERHRVMTDWAFEMLAALGMDVRTIGKGSDKPCLLVANHLSYADIPLMMAVTPTVFVAKKQLSSWPVFGKAMRSVRTVLVDRDSRDSRKNAADAVAPAILNGKEWVTIFPTGTTTLDEAKPWRWGAFVIAKRYGILVQPVRIRYTPKRKAAYIDKDIFLPHLWSLTTTPGGVHATVEFGEPFYVDDPQGDAERHWRWVREGL